MIAINEILKNASDSLSDFRTNLEGDAELMEYKERHKFRENEKLQRLKDLGLDEL